QDRGLVSAAMERISRPALAPPGRFSWRAGQINYCLRHLTVLVEIFVKSPFCETDIIIISADLHLGIDLGVHTR
ncbi:MAG: hypothetical protein KJ749_15595, partial [Planctomycetes bacterium]|nr:hypothetical protein [Planctomycetota bacterium]